MKFRRLEFFIKEKIMVKMKRKYKKYLIVRKSKTTLAILFVTTFFASSVNAYVTAIVNTGMACGGWPGSGSAQYISGSVGGWPLFGAPAHSDDAFKVVQSAHLWKCDYFGSWSCDWDDLFIDETSWEQTNSYITNAEGYVNTIATYYGAAGNWTLGYYWSFLENYWQSSEWIYHQDNC